MDNRVDHSISFAERIVDQAMSRIGSKLRIVPVDDIVDRHASQVLYDIEVARQEREHLNHAEYEMYRHEIEEQEHDDWLDQHCSKCGEPLSDSGDCTLCQAEERNEQITDH